MHKANTMQNSGNRRCSNGAFPLPSTVNQLSCGLRARVRFAQLLTVYPNVDETLFTCATIGTIQSWGGTSSSDRQHWRLLYSCHLEGKIFQIAGFWGFSKGFNCLILVFPRLCDHCSIASFHETETKTKSAKQIFLSHMLLFLLDPESLWLRK